MHQNRNCAGFQSLGFTLIELLVVLSIVSTLLLLATPRYFERVEISKEVVLRENLRSIREVLDRFYSDTGRYPESLDELVVRHYLRAVPIDPLTGTSSTWRLIPAPPGLPGNVFDVRSGASGKPRDGSNYENW